MSFRGRPFDSLYLCTPCICDPYLTSWLVGFGRFDFLDLLTAATVQLAPPYVARTIFHFGRVPSSYVVSCASPPWRLQDTDSEKMTIFRRVYIAYCSSYNFYGAQKHARESPRKQRSQEDLNAVLVAIPCARLFNHRCSRVDLVRKFIAVPYSVSKKEWSRDFPVYVCTPQSALVIFSRLTSLRWRLILSRWSR